VQNEEVEAVNIEELLKGTAQQVYKSIITKLQVLTTSEKHPQGSCTP